jgi:RIO kinase 1
MKITLQDIEKISEENNGYEKFVSRKRKLTSRNNVGRLISENETGYSFNTSDLEDLRGRGILLELIREIKSGKEASVYLGKTFEGYSAVKIYTDLRVRSFRKDEIYRQGRFIGDQRIEKAINQGSEFGLNAHQILWVQEEFRQMTFLYESGIPVPKPISTSGLVIVMQFIGLNDEAALRVSDFNLDKDEAEDAFRQSLTILEQIVKAGRVHGDFSSYNILWHEGKAFVIDFPQVVGIKNNSLAVDLLRRDINSLCKSFKKFNIQTDSEKIFNYMIRKIPD